MNLGIESILRLSCFAVSAEVTAGSDSGFIYSTYGFGYVRELELLQEAGFHPLEVIQSATLNGAQALGMEQQIGSLAVGKLADITVLSQDLMTVPEDEIPSTEVLYTILGGEIVYQRN